VSDFNIRCYEVISGNTLNLSYTLYSIISDCILVTQHETSITYNQTIEGNSTNVEGYFTSSIAYNQTIEGNYIGIEGYLTNSIAYNQTIGGNYADIEAYFEASITYNLKIRNNYEAYLTSSITYNQIIEGGYEEIEGYFTISVVYNQIIEGGYEEIEGFTELNIGFIRNFSSYLSSPQITENSVNLIFSYFIDNIRGLYIQPNEGRIKGSFTIEFEGSAHLTNFYTGQFYHDVLYQSEHSGTVSGRASLLLNINLIGAFSEHRISGQLKLTFTPSVKYIGNVSIVGTVIGNIKLSSQIITLPEILGTIYLIYSLYNYHYGDYFKYTKENMLLMNINTTAVSEIDTYTEVVSIGDSLYLFNNSGIGTPADVLQSTIEFSIYDIDVPLIGKMDNLYFIGVVDSANTSVNSYVCDRKGVRRSKEMRFMLPRGITDRNLTFKINGKFKELQAILLDNYLTEEVMRNIRRK
jgi:hypothetical protein